MAEKKTVVCIQHEPEMICLITKILERNGLSVIGAECGQEGLDTVRRVKPHLVLLDLALPDIDGWEVCRQIRMDDELKCIPVVVITVKTTSADRARALQVAKVDDYLTKPFLPQALLHSVRQALGVEF